MNTSLLPALDVRSGLEMERRTTRDRAKLSMSRDTLVMSANINKSQNILQGRAITPSATARLFLLS